MLIGKHRCYVIELSKPIYPPEAFYVGLVFEDREGLNEEDGEKVRLRYFTLEKVRELAWPAGTQAVFAEWTAEGNHVNYGPLV